MIPGFISAAVHAEWYLVATLIAVTVTALACREIWRM